jgi:AraC-like DNA-binding protein
MQHRPLLFHTWHSPPATIPRLLLTGWYDSLVRTIPEHRKCRPEWTLDYSYNHHGRVRVGSETAPWQEREAGVLHLYSPGTPYWEDTTTVNAPIQGGYVVFEGGESLGLAPGLPYLRIEDPARQLAGPLQQIALAGHDTGDDGYWKALALFITMQELLGKRRHTIGETYTIPADGSSGARPGIAGRLRETMLLHLNEPLSLKQLASRLHVSPSALSHRFRTETGISPMQALIALRLNKAQALLRSDLTLEEIAVQTGFCDAFHLSKTYKRRYGTAPRKT